MITARDLQEPQDHINNGGYHIIVCTSSTRPGSPVDGQHIYETDTDKTLSWDGTSWNPVSGAASYQPGEPANPSVGSLWVDSDETASQLNTNDFLLKADASAASGYVSKVGGDTVVASGAAVKPLILKGASAQTANLQEWQDSTGAVVASVSPTGNIVGSGMTLVNSTSFSGVTAVNFDNVFTSSFRNYRIMITISQSATTVLNFRYRTGGTNNTTSNYLSNSLGITNWSLGGVVSSVPAGSSAEISYATAGVSQTYTGDILLPQVTTRTILNGFGLSQDEARWRPQLFNGNTQFDGIAIYPATGNITGNISIYAYKDA
jgi:hypothetical protein